jgi:hypothetical protein
VWKCWCQLAGFPATTHGITLSRAFTDYGEAGGLVRRAEQHQLQGRSTTTLGAHRQLLPGEQPVVLWTPGWGLVFML